MRPQRFLITLLLCLLSSVWSLIINNEENELLLKGLKIHNISGEELGFEKKWALDSIFLLKTVSKLMDNPLKTPEYIENTVKVLDTLKVNLDKLLFFLIRELEGTRVADLKKIKGSSGVKDDHPQTLEKIPEILKASFKLGNHYLKEALKNLRPSELDTLLLILPTLWSDDEDTITKFKGALFRQLGKEIDTTFSIEIDTILKLITKIDFRSLAKSYLTVALGVQKTLNLVKNASLLDTQVPQTSIPADSHTLIKGRIYYYEETPWGKFVIGSEEDNEYVGDFSLIIDLGGNDHYKGSIASGIGVLSLPFSVVIDQKGNDFYDSSDRLFSIGTGIFGAGFLIDLSGHDIYKGSHYSVGAGLLGVGLVMDYEGDDNYFSGNFSQGAGNFGLGVLIDNKGNDTYRAYEYCQAFSSTWGYGLLMDLDGNDLYYAGGQYLHTPLLPEDHRSLAQGFSIGFRPIAGGGIGLLYDKSGQDCYYVGAFGQGCSYWYSLGMLYDQEGNDFYNATQYAQGAGIHLAVGILVDKNGDDHYFSRFGPAQGEGHDLSVGILIDKEGNDSYITSGGQGVGLTNSFGLFLDSEGDDLYATREKDIGQGTANWARGFGGIGLFLDLSGDDKYPRNALIDNNTFWTQTVFGSGIDLKSTKVTEKEPPQEEPDTTTTKIEDLFKMASLWEVGSAKKKVRWAREKLKARINEARDYIFEKKITTKDGLELRAIEELAQADPDSFKPYLLKTLYHHNRWARANACYLLGKIKARDVLDSLLLAHKEKRIRTRTLIGTLEDIGDEQIAPIIIPYLKDQEEPTRIAAARALGKLKNPLAISALYEALSDKFFTVRIASESSLVVLGESAFNYLLTKSRDPKVLGILGLLASKLESAEASKTKAEVRRILISYLDDLKPENRFKALLGLSYLKDENLVLYLKSKMALETNEFIQAKYQEILR
jgi:hypothetical protein